MENLQQMLPMVERDEWLHPVADRIADRHNRYLARMSAIEQQSGSIAGGSESGCPRLTMSLSSVISTLGNVRSCVLIKIAMVCGAFSCQTRCTVIC